MRLWSQPLPKTVCSLLLAVALQELINGKADGSVVTTLVGEDTGKSVRAISAEEVAKIVAGADENYNTLKEIADWIMSDTTGATKMANDITRLDAILDGIGDTTSGEYATVVAYVEAMIAALGISDYAKTETVNAYMTDEEYENCLQDTFNKLTYREIPKELLTGEKWMAKSVNIGDQLSQVIGIYYPYRIDNYVKYVRSQKFYGRYMDDWYIMNQSKEELLDLLENIRAIVAELGIHINEKKTRIVKISSTYKFLQIKYSLTKNGKIIKRINSQRVTAMRRRLKKLAIKIQNEEVPYINVENMFKGWMGNFYKILSKKQRENIIKLYEELFGKRILVKKKKLLIFDRGIA